MKIKRFFAKDMRQAIRNVREELGPDAVILSNRKVNGGIEIVSAIDYDESLFSNMTAASERGLQDTSGQPEDNRSAEYHVGQEHAADTSSANASQPEWLEDPMLIQMKHELKNLRGVLENQLSQFSQSDLQRREPGKAAIIQRLERLGIDADLSLEFASMLSADMDIENGWRQALALVSHQIEVTDDDILSRGGVVALVGPQQPSNAANRTSVRKPST